MVSNFPKKILIITSNSFPIGMAGTNRILSYCEGFINNGYKPLVICYKPTEYYKNVFNTDSLGIYNNIKFTYPGGCTVRSKSFLERRINDFLSGFLSIKLLWFYFKKKEVSFVIFYGNCLIIELLAIMISKLYKIKIYKEESEHPLIYFQYKDNLINKVKKWFVVNKLYSYYSGILVMTLSLRDFFLKKGISKNKILVVPQTIAMIKFNENIKKHPFVINYEYIAYVGSLSQKKDGVLTLLEIFNEVSKKYKDIHLIIAGDGTLSEKELILSTIQSLNKIDRIHYIGRIPSNEIPAFLNKAKLVVSCRPKSIQSEYGFPTKLIEYLASGKPVVTTVTGEIEYYLEDKVNAFLVFDFNSQSFVNKIYGVLNDYDCALDISNNGHKLIEVMFNPNIQTKKIIEFNKN